MSYLTCPSCGLTLFDRTPLISEISPRQCPRCAGRGRRVELEPGVRPKPDALAKITNPGRDEDAQAV